MRRAPIASVLALLTACAPSSGSTDASLTVYAAASLRDAVEELATAYTDEAGVDVVLSFDSSSALRAQIEEGAAADVFLSADIVNAQALVDAGSARGEAQPFAANALSIVIPGDNPGGVQTWADLGRSGLRIVAAGEDVPITGYAAELLDNLSAEPDAPAGFADAYAANVVSEEDNVRAVLAKIEIGEGDAAIVYETDALSSDDVAVIDVPDRANVLAEYAAVIVSGGSPASDFMTWLRADEAQAILARHGFRPPG